MGETMSHKLQIWDGRPARMLVTTPTAHREELLSEAEVLARREVFQPRGRLNIEGEALTLPWFLGIERRRYNRHGRWIPRLLEFHKHSGESVLVVGGSLGTDWVQYARHGAEVQVVPSGIGNAQAIRQHFEERKLRFRMVMPVESGFPVDNASIDVLVLNFVDTQLPTLESLPEEAFRVLRPGGKLILLARAWWDIDAWWGWLPWYRHLGPRSVSDLPEQTRVSARMLRRCFTPFIEQRISRRHLRRAEVPHICRLMPLPLLERIVGRIIIFKAFKPISAALPVPIAA